MAVSPVRDDHVMPTTRVVAWAIVPVLTAAFAFEDRWSALRVPIEVAIIGMAMIGIGAIPAAFASSSRWRCWPGCGYGCRVKQAISRRRPRPAVP